MHLIRAIVFILFLYNTVGQSFNETSLSLELIYGDSDLIFDLGQKALLDRRKTGFMGKAQEFLSNIATPVMDFAGNMKKGVSDVGKSISNSVMSPIYISLCVVAGAVLLGIIILTCWCGGKTYLSYKHKKRIEKIVLNRKNQETGSP